MSKYVPDILSRRWVLIAPDRIYRPDNSSEEQSSVCVFCPGNEQMTGPEVLRIGVGEKDKPGWSVRVIPNKFPITDYHEVIIHTPDHEKDIESMPIGDIELVLQAYRARYNFYKDRGEVIIFCNHGEHAGASIKHAHSQLVVIPYQINLDALAREPIHNIVDQNKFFHIYCPDFSQWPYEVWIASKKDNAFFGDINSDEITELAIIMQKMLKRLEQLYGARAKWITLPFGYNYYIYPRENWFLRIIPRFIHRAGFELGSGLSVNIVDPSYAAMELRGEDGKVISVIDRLKKYNEEQATI